MYFTDDNSACNALGPPFAPFSLSKRTQRSIAIEEDTQETLRAITPSSDFFDRLPRPERGDWLAENEEHGQSYYDFVSTLHRKGKERCPSSLSNVVLLVPIGETLNGSLGRQFLNHIQAFCRAFYCPMRVDIHPSVLDVSSVSCRLNEHGHKQYLTSQICTLIQDHTSSVPNIFCRLGITFEDIYPGERWNFVFGEASMVDKAGVFSLARHCPRFSDGWAISDHHRRNGAHAHLNPEETVCWLQHALRTMVHEIGHMLQLEHCIYYRCVMNGSNGHHDTAGMTSFCCPICLRKVLHATAYTFRPPDDAKFLHDIVGRKASLRKTGAGGAVVVEEHGAREHVTSNSSRIADNRGSYFTSVSAIERYRAMQQSLENIVVDFFNSDIIGTSCGGDDDDDDDDGGGGGGGSGSSSSSSIKKKQSCPPPSGLHHPTTAREKLQDDIVWLSKRMQFIVEIS
jgi:archaemetzincin